MQDALFIARFRNQPLYLPNEPNASDIELAGEARSCICGRRPSTSSSV